MNFDQTVNKVELKLKYNCWRICLGLTELLPVRGMLSEVVDLIERGAAGDDYYYMLMRFLSTQEVIEDAEELAVQIWRQMDSTKYLRRTSIEARDTLELFVRFADLQSENLADLILDGEYWLV